MPLKTDSAPKALSGRMGGLYDWKSLGQSSLFSAYAWFPATDLAKSLGEILARHAMMLQQNNN